MHAIDVNKLTFFGVREKKIKSQHQICAHLSVIYTIAKEKQIKTMRNAEKKVKNIEYINVFSVHVLNIFLFHTCRYNNYMYLCYGWQWEYNRIVYKLLYVY